MKKTNNYNALFGWAMYDFANSAFTTLVVTFIYATYFTQAIAENEIIGTAQWSRGITVSGIMVALLSPFLGMLADREHHRKRFLFFFTVLAIISTAMLFTPLPGETTKALFWFVTANVAFEIGCVFYNAFLPEIAPPEKIGRVSGIGWGLGYVGGLLAMFVAMIGLVNPETPWFGFSRNLGENIRATNLLTAAWFGIFSIPIFLFIRERANQSAKGKGKPRGIYKELRTTFHEVGKYRQMTRFLVARLIYNDGLITIFAFGGIYAAGTFNFSFREIMVFGIVLNITAGIGAFAMGFLDDLLGGKKTVQISLAGLLIASILAVLAPNKTLFWTAGIIVGIFSGPNQSASRSLMGRFAPKEMQNQFFGFFALSGKLTAFLGPFLLGYLTEIFNSQRAGVSIVILFFIAGSLLLATVDEQEGIEAAGRALLEQSQ